MAVGTREEQEPRVETNQSESLEGFQWVTDETVRASPAEHRQEAEREEESRRLAPVEGRRLTRTE